MADNVATHMAGEVDEMEKSIRWLVERMPGHGQYLQKYSPAPA